MDVLSLFGYLGGLIYFVYILLLYLLRPIAEYSFHLKAARQLFYARTSHENIFMHSFKVEDDKMANSGNLTLAEQNEIDLHREIHITNYKRCCLFFVHCIRHILKNCCCNCIPNRYNKLLFLKDTIR